jgi:hypothetical protein
MRKSTQEAALDVISKCPPDSLQETIRTFRDLNKIQTATATSNAGYKEYDER